VLNLSPEDIFILLFLWSFTSGYVFPKMSTWRYRQLLSDPREVELLTKASHASLLTKLQLDKRLSALENAMKSYVDSAISAAMGSVECAIDESSGKVFNKITSWWGVQVRESARALEALQDQAEGEIEQYITAQDPRAVAIGRAMELHPELAKYAEYYEILQILLNAQGGNGGHSPLGGGGGGRTGPIV